MPGLTLLIHHVADFDERGLLLIIAEAEGRDVGEDDLPDPLGLQVVVDPGGDVRYAGPGVEQYRGDEWLLVLEGGHLKTSLEVVDEVLGEDVAHDDESVILAGMAVLEGGEGKTWDPYFGDLMAEGGYVIEVREQIR